MSAMPDRLAHVHEPEGIDTEPFEKQALDDVVETLMLYAEYPRPIFSQRNGFAQRYTLFNLLDWVTEHIDPADLAMFYIQQITDYSIDADDRRMQEADKVEKALREELRDSEIVRDRAIELEEEEKW